MKSETRNKALMTISDEHARLIDLLKALSDTSGEPVNQDKVMHILSEIQKEVAWHFEHEEEFMIESGYPRFMDHQKHHQQTQEEILNLIDKFRAGKMNSVIKLGETIEASMLAHMQQFDNGLLLMLSK